MDFGSGQPTVFRFYIGLAFCFLSPTHIIMDTKFASILLFCLLAGTNFSLAQTIKVGAFDSIVIAGYVDRGGFANFTGPNIN